MISSRAVPSAPAPAKPQGFGLPLLSLGIPSRSPLAWKDCPLIPPVDVVNTPEAFRAPVADGRSPVPIGPVVTFDKVQGVPGVGQVGKIPLIPSEITPTSTLLPSTWNCERAWSA